MTILGAGAATAAPATPSAINYCNVTSICFFYDGNETGAWWEGTTAGIADFGGVTFGPGGLDGSGQRVKNNAASAHNGSDFWMCVFYDENDSGRFDSIAPHSSANLVQTWNNNASFRMQFSHC